MTKDHPQFWSKVQMGPSCWVWIGARNNLGYGNLGRNGRTISAHRQSWEIHFGPIPIGLSVLHRCDNRACVNPAHLFLGTQLDNMRDAKAKGRMRAKTEIPVATVHQIRADYVAGLSSYEIGRRWNINPSTAWRIATGKRRQSA